MARRLPDDPDKRRLQIFKRCYQSMSHWAALMEDRGMPDVITTPEGEDIYLRDLLHRHPRCPAASARPSS